MIKIYGYDYLVLVDENGRAYIAHADNSIRNKIFKKGVRVATRGITAGANAVRGRAGKGYYMRIGAFPHYRYFYSAEEYNRYLQNQREQYMAKINALENKRRIAEKATVFGRKDLRSNMKQAKKEYYKADDNWRKWMYEDRNHPEEYKKAKSEYEVAQKKYEDAKELYNLSRKLDDVPAYLLKKVEKSMNNFSEDPDKSLRTIRKILDFVV